MQTQGCVTHLPQEVHIDCCVSAQDVDLIQPYARVVDCRTMQEAHKQVRTLWEKVPLIERYLLPTQQHYAFLQDPQDLLHP